MDHQTKEKGNGYGDNCDRNDDQQRLLGKDAQQHVHNDNIPRQPVTRRRPRKNSHFFKFQEPRNTNRPGKKIRMAMKERMSKMPDIAGNTQDSNHYSKQRKDNGPRNGLLWRRPLTSVDTLPYPAKGVDVVYSNDPADAESWLKNNVIDAEANALGLDIEWRPQFISKKNGGTENKTAVLQLAVEDSVLVLHLFHMKSFPKSLSEVLADRNVLKVGSGIKGDVIKLIKDTGMLCDGRVDTQDYAKALGIIQGTGLKRLSKKVLDIDLNKPKRISLSNWEAFPLRRDQITYAALDAWISLKLYIKLKDQLAKKNEDDSKPQVIHIGVDKPEISIKSHTCQGCSDTLPTKGKLYRHKIRCVDFNAMRVEVSSAGNNPNNQFSKEQPNSDQFVKPLEGGLLDRTLNAMRVKVSSAGNNPNNQFSNEQPNSDQFGNPLEGGLLDRTLNAGASSSGYSGTSKQSEESVEVDVVVCPVSECRVKCQGQDGLTEHIKISRHACCQKCGKVFRSKVSRHHRKLHYSEKEDLSKPLN